jgi:hypothetical protein
MAYLLGSMLTYLNGIGKREQSVHHFSFAVMVPSDAEAQQLGRFEKGTSGYRWT